MDVPSNFEEISGSLLINKTRKTKELIIEGSRSTNSKEGYNICAVPLLLRLSNLRTNWVT